MVIKYIKSGFNAYMRNWLALSMAMAIITLVVLGFIGFSFVPMVFFGATELGMASIAVSAISVALGIIFSFTLQGGLTKMVQESLRGKTHLRTMVQTAKKKFWTLTFANTIKGIISVLIIILLFGFIGLPDITAETDEFTYMIPVMLAIIAGSFVLVFFLFVDQAVVINDKKTIDSIKHSMSFVKGRYFKTLTLYVLTVVISVAVSLIPVVGSVISPLVVAPIMLASLTAFYLDKKK